LLFLGAISAFLIKMVNPSRPAERDGQPYIAGWYFSSTGQDFPEWLTVQSKFETENPPADAPPATPVSSEFESVFTPYHSTRFAWATGLLVLVKQLWLSIWTGLGVRISDHYNLELAFALIIVLVYATFIVLVRPHIANIQNLFETITAVFEFGLIIIFIAAEAGSTISSSLPAAFAVLMILAQLVSQTIFIVELFKFLRECDMPPEPKIVESKPPASSDDGTSQTSQTATTKPIKPQGSDSERAATSARPSRGGAAAPSESDVHSNVGSEEDARSVASSEVRIDVRDGASVYSDDRSDVQSESDAASVVSSVMTEMSEWHWEPYVGRWIWKKSQQPGEEQQPLDAVGEDDMLWT
jgi:hypothetical protein